ncbi:MAG: Bax inhibitor-1/YccA family protein [Elusimicrobiota bacterium]|jgi:uncharacterized YccA/Bax inhibitor family protein|nr:Bax inhibitor-1/YccA family protein [Elusimicrobiota bacterium]
MANPLLKEDVFKKTSDIQGGVVYSERQTAMTISGTINKSIILLLLLGASAAYAWSHPAIAQTLMFPALIIGFILAMVNIFKPNISGIIAPIYALCEGIVLGAISLYFNNSYPGIVVNAVFLTIGVLFCMLAAYRAGLLRATPKFRKILLLSMMGIFVFYLINIVMSFFGSPLGYFGSNSQGAVLINLVIVVIAALNFIIDFDMIEQGAYRGAPKYMEWYCAFALLITLVWLYLEILRMLARRR